MTGFCDGGELFDRVSESQFSEREASKLARVSFRAPAAGTAGSASRHPQFMLNALVHCHAKDIAHRDLKPGAARACCVGASLNGDRQRTSCSRPLPPTRT